MISTLSSKKPFLEPGVDLGVDGLKCIKANEIEKKRVAENRDDTLVVHTYPRTKLIPNVDAFAMKLETYLRINKIPYKLDFNDYCKGPKGKQPWIKNDGKKIGDTQQVIQHLNETFKVDMNGHLTTEEKATAWSIQKWLEEYTYWLSYHCRWYVFWDDLLINMFDCPPAINKLIRIPARWWQRKQTKAVGIGCYSDEEVKEMMVKDLIQFAKMLGDKKFIMGDKISEVDCAAFGILSQIRWCTPKVCPGHQLLTGGQQQNVMDYLDRIKDLYWPDWDQMLANVKC